MRRKFGIIRFIELCDLMVVVSHKENWLMRLSKRSVHLMNLKRSFRKAIDYDVWLGLGMVGSNEKGELKS